MRAVTAVMLVGLITGGMPAAQQRLAGPRDMFYDPAWGQVFELSAAQSAPLRQVKPPDGKLQFVGIHYWFEGADHQPVTAFQAANLGGTYTLHIRSNVSGFMGIWSVNGQRLGIKPEVISEYSANRVIPEQSYTVSDGDFQFSPSARPTSVFVLFSRSETETVKTVADARNKLDRIVTLGGRNGLPALVHESEGALAGQVGTYVVNQGGGVVATEVIVSSTLAQNPPDDFAVRFEFGVCTTDVLDTFKGVFVRDMRPQPAMSTELSLRPDVLAAIYHAVVEARFFEYPEEFNPGGGIGVAPAEHYRLLVRNGSVSHQVHWVDSARASTEEATRMRALVRRITQYVFGLPEVAKLPRAPIGCA